MIYAICNPTAGNGRGKRIGVQVERALREKRFPCRLEMTQCPGQATEMARAAQAAGAEMVLAIGGDGTAFEVARGLVGTETPLGIIPAGTGNDFVKTIGVPLKPLAALDYILSHPARKTDVGQFNGRMFLNEIGTGFDVMVLDYAGRAKRFCRGMLPYLYGVLQTLFRFRPIPLTYSLDGGGETTLSAFVVAVANGGRIGGGIAIAPEARADDGLLDVVVVEQIPKRLLLLRLAGLLKGQILAFPEAHFLRARAVSFAAPEMRVNVDGEVIPQARVDAQILPGALLVHR